MKTRLELEIMPQPHFFMSHQDNIITAGSCFATCTGAWLHIAKFQVMNNPFGIIFNPITLCDLLCIAANKDYDKLLQPSLFVEREGNWFHYFFHSTFTEKSPKALQKRILQRLEQLYFFLQQKPILLLTFGTAWVYELKSTQQTVANCHKLPATLFEKKLLSVPQIVDKVQTLLSIFNKIIITVSPVIHVKDTLPLNNVSKSVLRLAAHELSEQYPQQMHYFPAYELLRDDLRDYRFFAEDMLHPSAQAEKYIYDKFTKTYFSESTQLLAQECLKIQQQLQHRPFDEKSAAYANMLERLLEKLIILNEKIPQWNNEIEHIRIKIDKLNQNDLIF